MNPILLPEKTATARLGAWGGNGPTLQMDAVGESFTWWQARGLSYTATGYGRKIPTSYVVKHRNRWRRVYCSIFSNNGTCFVRLNGADCVVDIW